MPFPGYQNSFGFPGIYLSDIMAKPLVDGEGSPFLTDQYRRLVVTMGTSGPPAPNASNAYTWIYKSSVQEHKGIARAEAALFAQAYGNIDKSEASAVGSAVYYLQFYNSTTVPADGATADLELAIEHTNGITTTFNISAEIGRVYFATGISWALSSTQFTKTEIATNKAAITVLGY